MKFARTSSVLALAAMACVGSSALAQTGSADTRASKWERAKVQIETVCREHEAKQRFDLAAQCYDDVTAMLTAAPTPPIVAEPPRRPDSLPAVASAPRKPVAAPKIVRRPEPKPVRVAARPAPRLAVAAAAPAPEILAPRRESRRCANLLCQQYVLLGIGY